MNKYAKEYIRSFANVINQKSATELKLNEMVAGGKAVFDFLSRPFKDAYRNSIDAKQLYAAGQPEAAKAKNYQALGNLAIGGAGLIPVGRGITWGGRMITGGVNTVRPFLRSLSNATMTGGFFGGGALNQYGSKKYELSGMKDLNTPHGKDLIQETVLRSNPYLSITSFDKIQTKPVSERSSILPHLEVLEKMTSGYNPR